MAIGGGIGEAMLIGSLAMGAVSTIGSIFKSRKIKKQMKAQAAAISAQTQQGAAAVQARMAQVLGGPAAAQFAQSQAQGGGGQGTPAWAQRG